MENISKIKLPNRDQFKTFARDAIDDVLEYYESQNLDFGSQSKFEDDYCKSFSKYMTLEGLGYTDVVCSGTAAIYVALLSLELGIGGEILVSSITDPGMISPIIIAGFSPKLVDNEKNLAHPSLKQIKLRNSPKVKAIILNHLSGKAVPEIEKICIWAKENNIKVIEDVSQAHGSEINKRKLGTFGDIACFSTMNTKNHSTGGRGGVIYTAQESIYNKVRMYADKGKPFHIENFNPKNPNTFQFPALNLNIDEISCALGVKTLARLDETIKKRKLILKDLKRKMENVNLITSLLDVDDGDSPFFAILRFDDKKFKIGKEVFTKELIDYGVTINANYPYVAFEWPWLKRYLADDFSPINALEFRNSTFNLLFNENFTGDDIDLIVKVLMKIESKYAN
jgi:dTDP-4-amino-4,6-dideoxygalactose transaminase